MLTVHIFSSLCLLLLHKGEGEQKTEGEGEQKAEGEGEQKTEGEGEQNTEGEGHCGSWKRNTLCVLYSANFTTGETIKPI
jgi:hypothetical protein